MRRHNDRHVQTERNTLHLQARVPRPPANLSCESAKWQLRQALDMQASALWLISAAQLCRAIAARLVQQKKLSPFFFFSPHHFLSLPLLCSS